MSTFEGISSSMAATFSRNCQNNPQRDGEGPDHDIQY